jgi:acyl-CoA dehydrogenase
VAQAGNSPTPRSWLRDWRLHGSVAAARWLPAVSALVLVLLPAEGQSGWVAVANVPASAVLASVNLAGEPVGQLTLDGVSVSESALAVVPAATAAAVRDRHAVLRAAAIGGAIERACQLTTQHVAVREQFGRPLITLQAVAHGLAELAAQRDLVTAAVDAALAAPGPGTAAAARACAARSAGVATAIAHQLHGAIGITREYPLHLVTRRLWAWRDADGSQRLWEQRLGAQVLAGQHDAEL